MIDVVRYFSQVNECCNELGDRKIKCVMGNHDWYMASGMSCVRSKSVNNCLRYKRRVITEENIPWVRRFLIILKVQNVSMVHVGWNNPINEYAEISETYFEGAEGFF